jgi:hypothetical protein
VSHAALARPLRPTGQQRLLLRCALRDDETVRDSWAALRPGLDIDRLDDGSYALLPLVYRALTRAGVAEPLLPRLKGIYRKTWFANQLMLDWAQRPLGMLRHVDADPLTLHGSALMTAYYPERALRRVPSLDVAVRTGAAERALRSLERSGWARHPGAAARNPAQPVPLVDVDGHVLLLWAGLPEALRVPGAPDGAEDELWERAAEADSASGGPALVLDATDQLLCACAVGVDVTLQPQPQWLADAGVLLVEHAASIDWQRLAESALARRVGTRLQRALDYLAGEVGLTMPPGARLAARPAERREKAAYRLYASRGGRLGGLPQTLERHVRQTAHLHPAKAVATAPRFLGDAWGIDGPGQLPRAVARKARLARQSRQRSALSRGS